MNGIAIFDKTSSYNKLGITGTVRFHQCDSEAPVKVQIKLSNLPPNSTRAIHIHEFGDFTEGCKSAGPHYNPHNQTHGTIFIDGMPRHAGDLINNITSDDKGEVFVEYMDDLVKLFGKDSVIGRSIVIHKRPDDFGLGDNEESLVTGNAGDRMACSVIGLEKPVHF